MALIKNMEIAAKSVGINTFFTKSDESIDTQLRRLTKEEDHPLMLISWDIDYTVKFDENGFILPPAAKIVVLLLTKPEEVTEEEGMNEAENMGALFLKFLMALSELQVLVAKTNEPAITEAGYKLVPVHGVTKHSGILGRFRAATQAPSPC